MIRRLARLSAGEWALLARAAVNLLSARIALSILGFRRTRRLFAMRPSPHASDWSPHRVAWAVQAVSRVVPGSTCLVRSLTLERLLRSDGHPARLRLGIARSATARLAAHAWVESDGAVLLAEPGFEALEQVPG
jgi:hypothetical protein